MSDPTASPAFAELHCLSNFTFLRGASRADELVRQAVKLGYRALAITDECSLAGIVRAHEAAREHGLKLVIGSEIRVDEPLRLVLLAIDREGYGNLCTLITRARRREHKGSYRLTRTDLEDGVPGCMALWLPACADLPPDDRPETLAAHRQENGDEVLARWLLTRFGDRLRIAAERHRGAHDAPRLAYLDALSAHTGIAIVATNDVHMHTRGRRALQDVLTAIRLRTSVAEAGLALHPNAERHLRPIETLARLYPLPWLEESVRIAERCTFSLEELRYEYPEEVVPPGETPSGWLRRLTEIGLRWRFGNGPAPWECVPAGCEPHGPGDAGSPDSASLHPGYEQRDPVTTTTPLAAEAAPSHGFTSSHLHDFTPSRLHDFTPSRLHDFTHQPPDSAPLHPGYEQHDPVTTTTPLAAEATPPHDFTSSRLHDFTPQSPGNITLHPSPFTTGSPDSASLHPGYERHAPIVTATPLATEAAPPHDFTPSRLHTFTSSRLHAFTSPQIPPAVSSQIEHELSLIADLRYESYFLTVFDIVCFARRRGILCQGRGSAANSAVCYVLGITEVDPARMSMLFERFISKERNEPPDIDVDFEHQRREEVIQYLYAKYTRERAALAATVICYRPKSAFRDVGKALGLDLEQVDRIARNLAFWDRGPQVEERLRECGFDPASRRMRQLLALTRMLIGFPRHLSQHVGGFVVSRGPLSRLVPVENAAMPERSIIQWDKDDLDALGLLKVDVLALGMLSAIRRALALVSAVRQRPFGMQHVPPEDPAVYDMLCKADTVGVFQIESRAQMSMLPRLKPRRFYDLVIEVAIVRPGPIQGGMVHPYLRRRQGIEKVTYPSEAVRSVLERTLGVPIFQEQVMQLAVVAAGFTPGEADHLRRSMAAWRRKGGLTHFQARLTEGMRARGYPEQFAQQIYQQILGFGEYGFPESHSASFALLVYVSAWLKCHEPAAFCAALLNSQPMGFYAPSQLVQDAQRHGVEVRPADALASQWDCTLETDIASSGGQPAVRLGLRMVRGLSQAGAERLIAERDTPFDTFEQLALRARLDRRDLECLAHADALRSVSGHRRLALWEVAGVEARPPLLQDTTIRDTPAAFAAPTEGETIVADYASLGLTLGRHPLVLLRPLLRKRRMLTTEQLQHARHGSLVRAAGLVTCRQRPGTASGVIFVTLEDETGSTNVVVWRDLADRQRRILLGAKLLAVHGVLEREGNVAHLIAGKLEDLSSLLGQLVTHSRDFH